jgi:hypothetical protein
MRRILDGMTLEVLVERQREIERKHALAEANNGEAAPGVLVNGA